MAASAQPCVLPPKFVVTPWAYATATSNSRLVTVKRNKRENSQCILFYYVHVASGNEELAYPAANGSINKADICVTNHLMLLSLTTVMPAMTCAQDQCQGLEMPRLLSKTAKADNDHEI